MNAARTTALALSLFALAAAASAQQKGATHDPAMAEGGNFAVDNEVLCTQQLQGIDQLGVVVTKVYSVS